MGLRDDEHDDYEPEPEEIEAMRDAELEFRATHDLLDNDDWDAYCESSHERLNCESPSSR